MRLNKLPVVLIKLEIAGQLFRDKNGEQVVNELSLKESDRLKSQQRVQQECVWVCKSSQDASLGIFPGLRGVFGSVRSQQLDHHLGSVFAKKQIF